MCRRRGNQGHTTCRVCIDRAAARTHLQAQALRLYKRRTDRQTDWETETERWREGAAVCGGGLWEQKTPRVLLLLLLKERVKREKEIEDESKREKERERDCWLSWLCSRG